MKRYAGVLLSVTSLPSRYGIGCFDQAAYDFVDWLVQAGQRYWQILPLGSTSHGGSDDSPYQAYSAFAGNPYLISLDALVEEGLLTRQECDDADFGSNPGRVDYDKLHENRFKLLHLAYERSDISRNPRYAQFLPGKLLVAERLRFVHGAEGIFQGAALPQLAGGHPDALELRRGLLQPDAVL